MLWGGGLSRSKLLAAVAVLAIAFAVFAAVPAVAEDSDAAPAYSTDEKTASVANAEDFTTAISNTKVETINITADFKTSSAISINRAVTINGGNHTITATGSEWANSQGSGYVLNITAAADINDLNIDSNEIAGGVNVSYADTTVLTIDLNDVDVTNYIRAGFAVGQHTVNMTACSATNPAEKAWGGLNVGNETVAGSVTLDTLDGIGSAYTENTSATIGITDNDGVIEVTVNQCKVYGTSSNSAWVAKSISSATDITVHSGAVFTVPSGVNADVSKCNIIIENGATFSGNVINDAAGAYVSVTADSKTNSKVKISNETVQTARALTTGATPATPVVITGEMSAGEIKGKIEGADNIVLKDVTITDGKLEIGEDVKVSIAEGSTVKIEEGAALSIASASDLSKGTIENDGTLFVNNKDIVLPSITGTGSVDTSGIASDGTISGDWKTSTKYGAYQTITLTGDTTLVEGTLIIIEGKMIIPEGVTLTIEDGARLVLYNGTAELENDGTIIVESKMAKVAADKIDSDYFGIEALKEKSGGFIILAGASAVNDGSIILDYTAVEGDGKTEFTSMNLDGANFENNGTITVGEDSYFANYQKSAFKNTADGVVDINGMFAFGSSGKFQNAGTVTINGALMDNTTISLTSADAKVDVVSISGNGKKLTINDTGFNPAKTVLSNDTDTLSVVFAPAQNRTIEGMTVTLALEKNTEVTTGTEYYKQFSVAGAVASSYIGVADEPPKDTLTGTINLSGRTAVADALSIGEFVEVNNASSMYVSGTITVVSDAKMTTTGAIYVTGKITVAKIDLTVSTDGSINAAKYEVAKTTTTEKQTIYTSFETAVADGAKKITLLNKNTVTKDITVPTGVAVTNSGELVVKTDAKVTFDAGSTFKNAKTTADGVVYIADVKGTLKTTGDFVSDVIMNGEKDRTYCGVAYALGNANPGDTVKLSKDTVTIKNSVEIPAEVTLDTDDKAVVIGNNVTLTVNGVFYINKSDVSYAPVEGVKEKGEIVLNGMIKSDDDVFVNALKVSAAYYYKTEKGITYTYAEPVSAAALKIAEVDDQSLGIHNFDSEAALKIDDVTFAGKPDMNVDCATIVVYGDVVASSITLSDAGIIFTGSEFTGTITDGTGTLDLAGVAGYYTSVDAYILFSVVSTVDDDEKKIFEVAGGFYSFNDKDKKDVFTVSGEAALGPSDIDAITVDGILNIDNENARSVIDKLVINGTVNVLNNSTLDSDVIEVYGTLAVSEATATEGKGVFDVDELYLGVSEKTIEGNTGAVATVTGPVIPEFINILAVVAAGSSIPESAVKNIDPTEFFVEDELYVTAYDFDGTKTSVQDIKTTISNAEFKYWLNDKGEEATENIGDIDKVTAKIDYEVYEVVIVGAEGVIDISIDGNLVSEDTPIKLTAGEHKITYNVAIGYSGEAKLAFNGAVNDGTVCTIDGMSFNISGDHSPETGKDRLVTFQLTGIEKTGYVPDAPDNNDSGMTITDYLLIILVVLIVVMAIIVAMRLMRS
ncbi:beta strand repeat-containing protein [Candidatus Methanoprimaticola sp. MG2]|uniref:beta strand repeat-containing protein n=1 Tax=Candidatus Methanoprimaticola sp. MG2 TaxID=3228838 RepID=UPI0039C6642E